MKFKLYKFFKIRNLFKKNKFFLIFFCNKYKFSDLIKIRQNLKKINLNAYKIDNSILINLIYKSIFLNFKSIFTGSSLIVFVKKNVKFLKNLNKTFSLFLISIKLKNKIYTFSQLKNINNLCFLKNSFELKNTIKFLILNLLIFFRKI